MLTEQQLKTLKNMPMEERRKKVYQWIWCGKISLADFENICEELLLGS